MCANRSHPGWRPVPFRLLQHDKEPGVGRHGDNYLFVHREARHLLLPSKPSVRSDSFAQQDAVVQLPAGAGESARTANQISSHASDSGQRPDQNSFCSIAARDRTLQRSVREAHGRAVDLLRRSIRHLQRAEANGDDAAPARLLDFSESLRAGGDENLAILFVVVFDGCDYGRLNRGAGGNLQARDETTPAGKQWLRSSSTGSVCVEAIGAALERASDVFRTNTSEAFFRPSPSLRTGAVAGMAAGGEWGRGAAGRISSFARRYASRAGSFIGGTFARVVVLVGGPPRPHLCRVLHVIRTHLIAVAVLIR